MKRAVQALRRVRFPTLSLVRSLALAFACMVALLVAVTAVATWELRAMGTHLRRIVDDNNPKVELAHRLLGSIHEMSIQARTLALLTDPAQIEAEGRRMQAARAHYARSEQAFLSRTAGLRPDDPERRLVEAIVALGREALPLLDRAAREGQEGANIQATETLTRAVRPLEAAWQERVGQLVTLEVQRNEASEAAAKAGLRRALASGAAMVCAAAAAGLLLGWRIVRRVKRPIDRAIRIAERIAEGDLANPVVVDTPDEIGRLLQAISRMQDRLRDLVTEIRQSADSIHTASAEVSAGSLDLQQRTESTAARLRSTSGRMEELNGAVRLTAESARTADELAVGAAGVAERGGVAVSQVAAKMEDMGAASRRIADIVGVIDLIAFQTNVLALNAAVEAAQAGEAGRGFAVVAAEVRALSRRCAGAAREIKALIEDSVAGIAAVCGLVEHAGGTMSEIVGSARHVTEVVAEISAASAQQSSGMQQISTAIADLDDMTQHNSALVEQSAASAEMLREQAQRLMALVLAFKVGPQLSPTKDHTKDHT
ncbi:MAG: HAMP domain-containing protein [Aquabacterium sp.]|nr:MAG: HAMP domain-containing protein [Aquabacterium sp.]